MRKFAWLMLFSAAALFFSAPESAFAHGNHRHAEQTQATQPVSFDRNALEEIGAHEFEQSVSAADYPAGKCPHGHRQADCGFCCACAGNASVALASPEFANRVTHTRSEQPELSVAYEVRQAVLDLSRPPKTFA